MEAPMTFYPAQRTIVRAAIYKLLAKSFLYPTDPIIQYIQSPDYAESVLHYASLSVQKDINEAAQDLIRSIKTGECKRAKLESEYTRLFAHLGSAKSPPYETEYGYENIFQKTQAMADIAGFYRAYGLEVAQANAERVDFIGTELEFLSYLAMSEEYGRLHDAQEQMDIAIDTQKKFLHDHLGRWIGIFTKILVGNTDNSFYRSIGNVAQEVVEADLAALDVKPETISLEMRQHDDSLEPFDCSQCANPGQTIQSTESRLDKQFDV